MPEFQLLQFAGVVFLILRSKVEQGVTRITLP